MSESIVYITTNKINGKKYIGSHYGPLDDGYLGSGVKLKEDLEILGEDKFKREILWNGPKEYMREMEEYWCEYFNVANNDMFYNLTNKGVGPSIGWNHSEEAIKKMKTIAKERGFSKETYTPEAIAKRVANTDFKDIGEKIKLTKYWEKRDNKALSEKRVANIDWEQMGINRSRPFSIYDLNGKLIGDFLNRKEAKSKGFDVGYILNKNNKNPKYKIIFKNK
jgi:hypothetical protein